MPRRACAADPPGSKGWRAWRCSWMDHSGATRTLPGPGATADDNVATTMTGTEALMIRIDTEYLHA